VRNIICLLTLGMSMAQVCAADSLFATAAASRGTLIAQKTSYQLGDAITVMVRESVDSKAQSDTKTTKKSTLELESPLDVNDIPFFPSGFLTNADVELNNKFDGKGQTIRKNSLITTITCEVVRVFANGNFEIAGEKHVTVNRDDSILVLRGTVRPRDVRGDNMVDSNRIMHLSLELTGKGTLWNNQRRGFLTKLFDFISPF